MYMLRLAEREKDLKKRNDRKNDFLIVIWFILILEVLIFLLAVIVGHICGYRNSFVAFGVMGALLGIPMLIVVFVLNGANFIIDMVMNKYKGKK